MTEKQYITAMGYTRKSVNWADVPTTGAITFSTPTTELTTEPPPRRTPDWQWPEGWWGTCCLLIEKPTSLSNPLPQSEPKG